MKEIAFYQLKTTPLERALPKLLEKAYGAGLRSLIVCSNQEQQALLNTVLWTYSPTAFLPHGLVGDPMDHPIWLSLENKNVNNAAVLFLTNENLIPFDSEENSYSRYLDIFDGNNSQSVEKARERYKHYNSQGYSLTFWKQTDQGGWEK